MQAVDKEKILARELAVSGAKGGFLGGGFGGALGCALGAYIGGKFMATEMAEKEVVCAYNYETTVVLFKVAMMALGGKEIDTPSINTGNVIMTRTVGAGTYTGAQAIMSVEIVKEDDVSTRVLISSAAKEAMFNKNVAAKYIAKLLDGVKLKAT
jgi:hypothetical protein